MTRGGSYPARWPWLLLAVGAVITSVSYRPALDTGFVFDDQPNIVDAGALHWTDISPNSVRAMVDSAWLPERVVANATFALNHRVGGLEPFGYHLVNVLIHLAVGMALFWFITLYLRADGSSSRSTSTLFAASAAATLFWVHPLNTQAVTYAVQRMTSLAALFGLLTLAFYLVGRSRESRREAAPWWVAAFVMWLLAIGSKENAFVLPLVVAAWEWSFRRSEWRDAWKRTNRLGRTVVSTLVVAGMVMAVLVARHVGGTALGWTTPWTMRDYNGFERVLTQGRVQLLYLSLLLWPAPGRLNLDHDFVVSRGLLDPASTLLAIGFWTVAFVGAVVLTRRRPLYGFPLLAYGSLHLIESGPVNLELVFEHRMYLPMCMLAMLVAVLLHELESRRRPPAAIAVLGLTLVLAGATYTRNAVWANPMAFYVDTANKSPNKFRPQYVLGTELARAGRTQEAQTALLRAVDLDSTQSGPHNQLGNTYLMTGQADRALEEYQQAVDLDSSNAAALYNLGMVLDQQGRAAEAEPHLRRFLEIAPPWLDEAAANVRETLRTSRSPVPPR